MIGVSVRFPRQDYNFVLRAIRNASEARIAPERQILAEGDGPLPISPEAEVLAATNEFFSKILD
ncbi:MAG: hypothetical protein ACI96M_000388 [Candidatus Azotimanducaceae bacterium]|jgi:hypothetical protein